jgi:DNA modification methylase
MDYSDFIESKRIAAVLTGHQVDEKVTIGNCELWHGDCMDYMAKLPDKAFELAIVDPPYGIGIGTSTGGEKLSRPKYTGDSTIAESPIKNTLMNLKGYQRNRLFSEEITFLTIL